MSRMSAGEFGGGMGMGIPANATAARGSQNIPMLASMPRGQYMSGAEAMGIPANAARGSQNIPMLARPDPVGLNVRRNVAASQQARAAAAKQRDAVAGSRSVIAQMRANSKASVTPVGVGGKRTPVAPVPGAGSGAPPAGALGDKQTNIVRKAIKGFKDMPRGRKALLAGAGAIGLGVLLGNRRERGTSSGAQQGRYGY
jgi:hypothetical protein